MNMDGTSIGYAVGLPRARATGVDLWRGETCAKAHTPSMLVDRVCACNVAPDYGPVVDVGVGVADSDGSGVSESVGVGVGVGVGRGPPSGFVNCSGSSG